MEAQGSGRRLWQHTLPILVLLVGLVFTAVFELGLRGALVRQSLAPLLPQHRTLARALDMALQARMAAASQLATAMALAPDTSDQLFRRQGLDLLNRFPDLAALAWASSSEPGRLIVRDGLPENSPLTVKGQDLMSVAYWRPPIAQAHRSGQPVAAPPSTAVTDSPAVATLRVFVPIPSSDSGPDLLMLIFRPKALAHSLLEPLVPAALDTEVYDLSQFSKSPLFSTAPDRARDSAVGPTLQTPLNVADRRWLVRSYPSQQLLDLKSRRWLRGFWLAGVLLSVVAAALVWRQQGRLRQLAGQLEGTSADWEKDRRALQNKVIEKSVLGQALADSEQRTRDFLELAPGFACELDEEWRIGFVSAQIHDLTGRPPAELAQTLLTELVVSDDRDRLTAALQACGRERQRVRVDTALVDGHGGAVPIHLECKPITDPLNHCIGFRATGWQRSVPD